MIKFFRKIRQNMIKENRVSKYMLYAIGEIILVVIGILIALQINNWNEHNKVQKSITNHLVILKQNLLEDQTQLKQLQQNMADNIHYTDSLIKQLKTLIPIDPKTTKYLGKLLLEYQFSPNKNAIETITQSNEIPLLQPKLQTAILNYYALIESTRERENISNNQIQSKYENYINTHYTSVFQKNNDWQFVKDFYTDDPRPYIPFDTEAFLADKRLEALITSRHFQSTFLHTFYSELLTSSNTILKLLNEEPNSNY